MPEREEAAGGTCMRVGAGGGGEGPPPESRGAGGDGRGVLHPVYESGMAQTVRSTLSVRTPDYFCLEIILC